MATAAEEGASLRIDKFMGENFHLWKFKMQMEERDLWGIVSGEEVEPTGDGTTQATVQKFRKRAKRAFATLCLSGTNSFRSFAHERQPKMLGISLKVTIRLSLK